MRTDYLFTSESVSEGHPDKVSDQISDAIVDLFLSKDPEARIACETLTTTQLVVLAGEIRCKGVYENGQWAPGAQEEIEQAVRDTVKRIGYAQDGFHWEKFEFINRLHGQSAHIAQGVDAGENKDEGAGDQELVAMAVEQEAGLTRALLGVDPPGVGREQVGIGGGLRGGQPHVDFARGELDRVRHACTVAGPGRRGQVGRGRSRRPGAANSSQLLLLRYEVSMPAAFNTWMPSGLGCWFSRGLLPAEYALKRVPLAPVAMWLSKASDKMLRAELLDVPGSKAQVEWVGGNTYQWTYTPSADQPAGYTPYFAIFVDDGHIDPSQAGSYAPAFYVAADAPSAIPVRTGVTTNKPTDDETGAIAGVVSVDNPTGGPLTYAVNGTAAKGTVTIDPSTGAYTFTPYLSARWEAAAAGTSGPQTTTFDVTVTDPSGTPKTVPITVPISARQASINSSTSSSGAEAPAVMPSRRASPSQAQSMSAARCTSRERAQP